MADAPAVEAVNEAKAAVPLNTEKTPSSEKSPPPFGLAAQTWANVEAIGKAIGLIPLAVGAVLYLLETSEREAAYVREAWRAVTTRPNVQELGADRDAAPVTKSAHNWGAKSSLEALVRKKQIANSIELSGADLSDAQLVDGRFGWSSFRGASLWNANLKGANLECADLRGTKFGSADLTGANFRGANADGAVFNYDALGLEAVLRSICKYPNNDSYGVIITPDGWETRSDLKGKPTIPKQITACKARNVAKPLGENC